MKNVSFIRLSKQPQHPQKKLILNILLLQPTFIGSIS